MVSRPHVKLPSGPPSLPVLLLSNSLHSAFGRSKPAWHVWCDARWPGLWPSLISVPSVRERSCLTTIASTVDSCGLVGSVLCTCWGFLCVAGSPEVPGPLGLWILAPEAQMWFSVSLGEGVAWCSGFPSCCPTQVPSCLCSTIVCLQKGPQILSLSGTHCVLSSLGLGGHWRNPGLGSLSRVLKFLRLLEKAITVLITLCASGTG